ncbi:MAG: tRNA dihydrouridine synthase DusB [Mycoplasmatales bacterium]
MVVMNKLKIGNYEYPGVVVLAPMAGVCDFAYKTIMRKYGQEIIYTEMVNDKALINGNRRTIEMIENDEIHRPVVFQIFGGSPETMAAGAKILYDETKPDFIDINMGCPAPKIVKNASGSSILRDTELVYEITKAVVAAVPCAVTVKMRVGWDDETINAVENAQAVERAGASAITVHGRTTKQMYRGRANWELIKAVKAAVNIPVIGNGDITTPQQAKEFMEYSGVDGVMIGRAAMGQPWLIHQIDHFLQTGELLSEPTISEKIDTCIEHLDLLVEKRGEKVAVLNMRGHASWYIKGISGATNFRQALQKANSRDEMVEVLLKIKENTRWKKSFFSMLMVLFYQLMKILS